MNWVIFRDIVFDMVGNKDEQILLQSNVYFLLKTNDAHDTFESFKSCVKYLNNRNYNFNFLAQLRFEIPRWVTLQIENNRGCVKLSKLVALRMFLFLSNKNNKSTCDVKIFLLEL